VNQFDGRLGELHIGPSRQARLYLIARHQDWPQLPPPRAPHIGGLQAMLRGHQPDDGAVFAVWAKSDDDGGRGVPHQPREWKKS
jgi:hypothetical protein